MIKKAMTVLLASLSLASFSSGAMADVMTYEEYAAAEVDTEVVIEAYVQAKQSWWENEGKGMATLYLQDEDGAYYVYNAPVEKEDYERLVEGQKVKVTGFKTEWSGENEIIDCTVEMEEGHWIARPLDITGKLEDEDLIELQNRKVSFREMTVEASKDPEGNVAAFRYNFDGMGKHGSDLYFKASSGDNTCTFVVETYLCDTESEVYKAVENLQIGDVINMEGFLYWYEGANPHITAIEKAR